MTARPVRIANRAGLYGDRVEDARETVAGGPIDMLTGDYASPMSFRT
jgi:hypothetical protein